MQAKMANEQGLSILAVLNVDRVLGLAAVTAALAAGAWLCSLTLL